MFIVPFANVYGRRICYIIFIIIGAAGAFASAGAPTYGGVIAGRGTQVHNIDSLTSQADVMYSIQRHWRICPTGHRCGDDLRFIHTG